MLSKSCQYAIRALLCISRHSDDDEKLELKDIADELSLPKPYLAKIMQQLNKHELVKSVKGPHGGFYLTRTELKKSLLDVVEAIDGLGYFNTCGLGLEECSATDPCPIHNEMAALQQKMKKHLASRTLDKLGEMVRNGQFTITR